MLSSLRELSILDLVSDHHDKLTLATVTMPLPQYPCQVKANVLSLIGQLSKSRGLLTPCIATWWGEFFLPSAPSYFLFPLVSGYFGSEPNANSYAPTGCINWRPRDFTLLTSYPSDKNFIVTARLHFGFSTRHVGYPPSVSSSLQNSSTLILISSDSANHKQ